MTKRAEHVDATRQQIAAAAARLHTTIGPANTSIAGIAEEAGVTRLTVYRHFPDFDGLFAACRAHWRVENPPPDASAWPAVVGLEPRARRAFTELYAWYRAKAEALFPIYRDLTTMPLTSQQAVRGDIERLSDAICGTDLPAGAEGRHLRAIARHLVDFRTWRSLAIDQGLEDADIVSIALRMLSGSEASS
jgi:AcrR family transcriptional regulator